MSMSTAEPHPWGPDRQGPCGGHCQARAGGSLGSAVSGEHLLWRVCSRGCRGGRGRLGTPARSTLECPVEGRGGRASGGVVGVELERRAQDVLPLHPVSQRSQRRPLRDSAPGSPSQLPWMGVGG